LISGLTVRELPLHEVCAACGREISGTGFVIARDPVGTGLNYEKLCAFCAQDCGDRPSGLNSTKRLRKERSLKLMAPPQAVPDVTSRAVHRHRAIGLAQTFRSAISARPANTHTKSVRLEFLHFSTVFWGERARRTEAISGWQRSRVTSG
jgi:hypothetical protein